ncbi:MAG: exonuclease domain-containing protein [Magnetospirillum sp.]|nr:exonuclease domain-containing protein [Magnetospirillum sp.]
MADPAVVVYDLEYTCWEGSLARDWDGPDEHREIVQIGAVALSAEFQELAALEVMVRPRINPRLSDYFTRLTGLSQARLDKEGVDIAEALARLHAFAEPGLPLASNGDDGGVIAENCRLAGLDHPLSHRCVNVEFRIAAALDGYRPMSFEIPELFGLPQSGRGHDALFDARAVAVALRSLWRQGKLTLPL